MSRKSKERRLTRLILAALVSAGGGMLSAPSVASAAITVTSTSDLSKLTNMIDSSGINYYYLYNDNVLNITGGNYTLNQRLCGDYGMGAADASGRTLNVSGDAYVPLVAGGYVAIHSLGSARGNTVNITGGTVDIAYGGFGDVDATDNTVNISGGEIGYVAGGHGSTGIVSGNTVNITGGEIAGDVWGGTGYGNAVNNTVNLLAKVAIGRNLVGGYSSNGESIGNTLNVAAKGITVGGELGYFQNLNFYLPTDTAAGDTMLTVTGTANVEGATFGVAAQDGLASLSKDDTVTLLKAGTLEASDTLSTAPLATVTASAPTGIVTSEEYEFEITKSGTDAIIATVTKAKEVTEEAAETARELSKSPVETRAATTTFVNAGADLLASQGFSQAANAVALDMAAGETGAGGFTPFAAFGGQGLRAQSGSYVDTKGFGLNIGFAREIENSQGKLLFGPVVEYGGGSYTSHLEDDAGTRGDGKAHYFGVGVMARQVNTGGFYYEGSVRGGRVTSDYESFLNNQKADYDSASNYWAAHVGVGKALSVGGGNTLDGYLKYFYSHQAGDDVTIHGSKTGDEEWSFDSVDSHRIRLGARLTHKVNERNSFYGGLAYQYEFGGEARAHYNGTATPSPSVKGSSGMLELGWQVKPGGPVTLDLGFTGWAGKQRGGSVQLGATWSF